MTHHTPHPWTICGRAASPGWSLGTGTRTRRLLLIGATGVFGRRFAEHMAHDRRFQLILASREISRATAAAESLSAKVGHRIDAVELKPGATFARDVAALAPWCVVNCSGPFHAAGVEIPSAALGAGAHYVDIADAPAFLRGFCAALGPRAGELRLSAIAGASSTPALSGAVVADLAQDLRSIETIELAIAPGGRGNVGEGVIRSILGYAGTEIPVWRDGVLQTTPGWMGAKRLEIGTLRARRSVPVETFDAELLGARHQLSGDIVFRAALESRTEQVAMEILAHGRKSGWVSDLTKIAPYLARLRGLTRLGMSDQGGMKVSVTGRNRAGETMRQDWRLIAECGHGPYVPILPAAAAVKAIAENRIGRGAKLACDALTLEEIEREMSHYSLTVSAQRGLGL